MKTDREKSTARNMHERVQELHAEYWEARDSGAISERLAIAQTHLYLAAVEGFTSDSSPRNASEQTAALRDLIALLPPDRWELLRDETKATIERLPT